MSTQYSNHRDTPMRRFSSFWLGLALFGVFGLVSAVSYWTIDSAPDVEDANAQKRLEVKAKVAEAQAALLPSEESVQKVSKQAITPVKATKQFVPGTAAYKKAMAAIAASSGGGEGFKLFTSKTCSSCHGADAHSPIAPNYPKLAGQSAEYLAAQLADFHNGKRTNGASAVMKPMVDNCSEAELKTLVDWLSKAKKPAVTLDDTHPGKALYVAKGCTGCHGADANSPIMPLYPKLAGQNAQYLADQMKAIKDGTRNNGQTMLMKGIISGVSDEEIKTLSEWLAGKK